MPQFSRDTVVLAVSLDEEVTELSQPQRMSAGEAPLTTLFKTGLPDDAPTNYAFDFINADALHEAVEVEGDTLLTTDGARYRVLYLGGNSHFMTLPVLRRLAELVEQGATVMGKPPRRSSSLNDDPAEFDTLVKRLIGDVQPGAEKVTWTSTPIYLPDASLRPSGLMGPVKILVDR